METEFKSKSAVEEVKRLQSCVNDLISIQALAGVWIGQQPAQIIEDLLEALTHILQLDLAYARVDAFINTAPIETGRLAINQKGDAQALEIGRHVGEWVQGGPPNRAVLVTNPFGAGELAIAIIRLGLREEIGFFIVGSQRPDFPTELESLVLRAAANQVIMALQETRRLGEQRQLATLQERQRLSRELHDSVSQALYGVALSARTARNRVEREPLRALEPLDNVLSLTEAALSEMRALIFELRPESLEAEGLVAALQKQAGYLRARHSIQVQTHLDDEPALALEVKQALYRIAQEALQNTAKHAQATRVELQMHRRGDRLVLEVRDNGSGFDTSQRFAGHLGLHTMRERVAQIGGTFLLESAPSAGTLIRVELPLNRTVTA